MKLCMIGTGYVGLVSGVCFSDLGNDVICVDNDKYKIPKLINSLQEYFEVFYNDNLVLYTIRHYTDSSVSELIANKNVLLEQKTRNTLQIIVKDN